MLKTGPFGEFQTLSRCTIEFVSDFGFRVSDLCPLRMVVPRRCAPPRPLSPFTFQRFTSTFCILPSTFSSPRSVATLQPGHDGPKSAY
jgi:hypothetical protein